MQVYSNHRKCGGSLTGERIGDAPHRLTGPQHGGRESGIRTLQLEPACNNMHVAVAGAGVEDGRANEGCSPSLPYTKHLHEETVTL